MWGEGFNRLWTMVVVLACVGIGTVVIGVPVALYYIGSFIINHVRLI